MTKVPLLAVLACALASSVSAQTEVSAGAGRTSGAVVPVIPFSAAPGATNLVSPLSSPGLTPSLSAPSISLQAPLAAPAALAVQPTALTVAVAPAAAIATAKPAAAKASALRAAAPVSETRAQASALSVLSAASVPDEKPGRLDATFDGSAAHDGDVTPVMAPASKPRPSLLGRAALAAGIWIAHPGIALAAQAPAFVEPSAMALVSNYGPLATALAAVLGALFGLWSARSKDGSPANAGQIFASSLSHGAIAGAAAFALLDLTKVAFLGAAATGLAPLTAAVATAALAQAAFSSKFVDPATTPADRIMGAFPAVAMAFGLSVGAVAFLPAASTMLTLGTAALMLTGAATALYTAIFRQDKSPATGPALMGRGFVLQALMTGLAVSLGAGPYAAFFFALGLCGFAAVMFATAREVWAFAQGLRPAKKP